MINFKFSLIQYIVLLKLRNVSAPSVYQIHKKLPTPLLRFIKTPTPRLLATQEQDGRPIFIPAALLRCCIFFLLKYVSRSSIPFPEKNSVLCYHFLSAKSKIYSYYITYPHPAETFFFNFKNGFPQQQVSIATVTIQRARFC